MKTVLVTGGSGFIGRWVVIKLLPNRYRVRTTLRTASREATVRTGIAGQLLDQASDQVASRDRLEFAIADLTSDTGWDAAVAGCDFVIHIASPLGREAPAD